MFNIFCLIIAQFISSKKIKNISFFVNMFLRFDDTLKERGQNERYGSDPISWGSYPYLCLFIYGRCLFQVRLICFSLIIFKTSLVFSLQKNEYYTK